MTATRVVLADDEEPARRRLARMLAQLGAQVVAEASDGVDALKAVRLHHPDVLFLDVRMPALDGVSLAQSHVDLPPVIFCTAHDEFAVQAFELNAVDYLLKPVRPERLAKALLRALERSKAQGRAGVSAVLSAVAPAQGSPRIVVMVRGEVQFFDARAVTRFWASDKYTAFLSEGREQLTEEPLVDIEVRLKPWGFIRVHRGDLVRLDAVKAFRNQDGMPEVTLVDGQVVRVSRRQVEMVRVALGLARG